MFFRKHTYVFSETKVCFFRETGACFPGASYVFPYALCIRLLPWLPLQDVPAVRPGRAIPAAGFAAVLGEELPEKS